MLFRPSRCPYSNIASCLRPLEPFPLTTKRIGRCAWRDLVLASFSIPRWRATVRAARPSSTLKQRHNYLQYRNLLYACRTRKSGHLPNLVRILRPLNISPYDSATCSMTGPSSSPPMSSARSSATSNGAVTNPSHSPTSANFATAGTKRKRGEPKFYSVQVGHQPGIYHTWADCFAQIKGFKRATCECIGSRAVARGSG